LASAAACGGFAAERRAGRRYRSTTPLQHGAAARRSAVNAGSVMLAAEMTRLHKNLFSLLVSV